MSFNLFKRSNNLKWQDITTIESLNAVEAESHQKPILILKHSTRCSISDMAKNRLELYWENQAPMSGYYLDLIRYRSVSDEIAKRFGVRHESPQVLLLKNGKCIYHASHSEIDYKTIKQNV